MSTTVYHFKRNPDSPLKLVTESVLESAIRAALGPRNGQNHDWRRAHETFKGVEIVAYPEGTGNSALLKGDVFPYDASLHKTALFPMNVVQNNPWVRIFARIDHDNPVRSTSMARWLDAVLLGRTKKDTVRVLSELSAHMPDDAAVPAIVNDPIRDYLRDRTLHLDESERIDLYQELLAAIESVIHRLRQKN